MTVTIVSPGSATPANHSGRRDSRILVAALIAAVVMIPVTLLLLGLDPRLLDDEAVWLKPLKFQIALGLHAATLLVLVSLLPAQVLTSRLARWASGAVGATVLYELAFIALQAGRGVRSHFNSESMFDSIGGTIMAAGAGVLTLAPALIGALLLWHLVFRRKVMTLAERRRMPVLLSVALGLILAGLMGMHTGGAIGANQGPFVGDATGPFLPLVGWSLTGGDLRIAHFLGIHAMQVLPVAGVLLSQWLAPRRAVAAILALSAGWVGFTLWCLAAAQAGHPPI